MKIVFYMYFVTIPNPTTVNNTPIKIFTLNFGDFSKNKLDTK